MSANSKKRLSLGILIAYALIRFGLDHAWRQVSPYYSYGFEFLFAWAVGYTFRRDLKLKLRFGRELRLGFLPALLGGFAIFKLIELSTLSVPFDFHSVETLALLLALAPTLEELLFRMALWEPAEKLLGSPAATLVVTTVLFSMGHLMALFTVPGQFKPFVLIQSLYVMMLGLGAGYRRIRSGTFLAGTIVHFGFNLGFVLAAVTP